MALKNIDLVASPDAPYDFPLGGVDEGTVLAGQDEYPDLEVQSVEEVPVDRIVWQLLRVTTIEPEPDPGERLFVGRLVAVLQNGQEVEIGERSVMPAELIETGVDTSRCEACFGAIRDNRYEIIDGHAYHNECVEPDDEPEPEPEEDAGDN